MKKRIKEHLELLNNKRSKEREQRERIQIEYENLKKENNKVNKMNHQRLETLGITKIFKLKEVDLKINILSS